VRYFTIILIVGLSLGLVAVTGLLFNQYRYFKRQTDRLLTLQEDYRTYMLAVNKILQDYNKTKEQLDLLKTTEANRPVASKKKKEANKVGDVGVGFYTFDFMDGVTVYSSDDVHEDNDEYFVPVNRDPEYLKSSALKYLRRLQDESLLSRIDLNDWGDYTDQSLNVQQKVSEHQKKKVSRKERGKKVAAYRDERPVKSQKKKPGIALSWPIHGQWWPSSQFGPRRKPNGSWGFHYGIDMAAVRGTLVYAAHSGIVTEARFDRAYGNTVVVTHSREYQTRYAHLHKILVNVGHKVVTSDVIGKVGSTGNVWRRRGRDPSHLHFEVHSFGKQVNPRRFLV
jgi:murein DD-endopeptidase MepM/ murein hydrolase activator NlpD